MAATPAHAKAAQMGRIAFVECSMILILSEFTWSLSAYTGPDGSADQRNQAA
jgi:hypothetical protein